MNQHTNKTHTSQPISAKSQTVVAKLKRQETEFRDVCMQILSDYPGVMGLVKDEYQTMDIRDLILITLQVMDGIPQYVQDYVTEWTKHKAKVQTYLTQILGHLDSILQEGDHGLEL